MADVDQWRGVSGAVWPHADWPTPSPAKNSYIVGGTSQNRTCPVRWDTSSSSTGLPAGRIVAANFPVQPRRGGRSHSTRRSPSTQRNQISHRLDVSSAFSASSAVRMPGGVHQHTGSPFQCLPHISFISRQRDCQAGIRPGALKALNESKRELTPFSGPFFRYKWIDGSKGK